MVRRGEVSPVEVLEAHLDSLARLNPELNAVIAVSPQALEEARRAGEMRSKGDAVGPLHGVPVTVKETLDVRGLPATAGSLARAGRVAETDATAVARLRAAGAIILGKTNCSEMALDYTAENPVYGRTLNPYDPLRTPGGSSGGCAAAVAAGLSAASLGSDLAGSVRIPAHFCGVVGLRPTAARVPRGGHCPMVSGAYRLGASLGPLTRTVEDARLLFRVLSGVRGAVSGQAAGAEPSGADSRSEEQRLSRLRELRVAFYEDDGEVPVSDEVREAVRRAARACEAFGMVVAEERPPHVERGNELWLALFSHATARFLRAEYAGREGLAGPAARALLTRAEAAVPPALDDFLAAWERRDLLRAELIEWMKRRPLLIAPVGAVTAPPHAETRRVEVAGARLNSFRAFGYAQAFNVFDFPAVCLPAGRTREGLPVGVQLVGRPREEELVLDAARVVERALGGWQPPPEISPQPSYNPL
jgi:amidase